MSDLVIERDPEGEDLLISWWPEEETLEAGAQVLVGEDELAVFFDGEVITTLGPGRHKLTPQAQPQLAPYLDDDEPRDIEVAFVRTGGFELYFDHRLGALRCPQSKVAFDPWVSCETLTLEVVDVGKLIANVDKLGGEDTFCEFLAEQAVRAARDLAASQVKSLSLRALLDRPLELDRPTIEAAVEHTLGAADLGVRLHLSAPVRVYVADEDREGCEAMLKAARD
jgi:hypothetical protein